VGLGGGETTSRFISALEIELGASPYSCVPKSRYPKAKLVQSASTSRLIMTFSCC
jgi:ribose 5-phosphate isomerase